MDTRWLGAPPVLVERSRGPKHFGSFEAVGCTVGEGRSSGGTKCQTKSGLRPLQTAEG
jgi:hypothetical protein